MRELSSEQYLKKVKNIYSLVIMATRRAASLARGAKSSLPDSKNLKAPIIALEEIAQDKITFISEEDTDASPEK